MGSDADPIGQFSLLQILPLGGLSIGSGYDEGFLTRGVRLWFSPRYGAGRTTISIDDDWLAEAELVIVRQTQEGSVERSLDIPEFPLATPVKEATNAP